LQGFARKVEFHANLAVSFRWWNSPDISSTRTLDGGVTVAKKKAAKKVAKKVAKKAPAKKAAKKCTCK
jgi:hypothetical protein